MKKVATLILFFFSTLIIGKTKYTASVDTIWYDCDYKVTTKEKADLYKIRPYIIKDKYIHVYYFKSTNKNHLISYSTDLYDTQLDGKRTYYFENGNVNYVINYKNNIKEGPYIEYYDNTKVYVQGEFRKDKKDGTFIIKNKDGSIFGKEYWSNGVKLDKPVKTKTPLTKAVANR
ncbi:toxin-antitoxin system YwqK family antitoxin [Flavobacterium sp. XGLA_31]|uniref:toxin-antitoxin system YwqK family antitoxin n=1 Tax=Flavobacterium sp. XGLA_31 TaxID=3447666 RepID=UPI003F359D14